MRYYGEVEWFGGFNNNTKSYNDYGFIENIGDSELKHIKFRFKEKDLLFDSKLIKPGTLVSFEFNNYEKVININLLRNENDFSLLERCLDNSYPIVWLSILKKYATFVSLYKGIITIENKFKEVSLGPSINIRSFIPLKYFLHSEYLRNMLNTKDKLDIYYQLLKTDNLSLDHNKRTIKDIVQLFDTLKVSEKTLLDNIDIKWFVESDDLRSKISTYNLLIYLIRNYTQNDVIHLEILNILKENDFKKDLIELIPLDILINNFWKSLPTSIKIDYFEKNLNLSTDIDYLFRLLDSIPEKIRVNKIKNFSLTLKMNYKIFQFLGPTDKVNQLWEYKEKHVIELWNKLDYSTKLFYLFKKAKYNEDISFLIDAKEEDPIIRSVLKIIWVKDKEHLKSTVFNEIHSLIQSFILYLAWEDTTSINLFPLLPRCNFGKVNYCEGKPWLLDGEEYVFCPRTNKSCHFVNKVLSPRIYPNCNLPWEEWSLLELLENSNIIPEVIHLKTHEQYVPKLSGWINRLNEIRERLKCTACGKILTAHYGYSVNLAAYNNTIFSCSCKDALNTNVYLSHCWGCREIIDSRYSKHKVDDYYLCLKCGSGRRDSKGHIPGSICPNCGSMHLNTTDEYNRVFECCDCYHTIRIPPKHKFLSIDSYSNTQ